MKEEAQRIEADELFRYIRIFSDLTNQMKYATQKRVLFEVTLIKIAKPQMETNPDSLLQRIRAMEAELAEKLAQISAGDGGRMVYAAKEQEEPAEKGSRSFPKL